MEEFLLRQKKQMASFSLDNYQKILLPIARLCLLGLFIDDGIRIAVQWEDQHRYISAAWATSPHWWPAQFLLAMSIFGQIVPCIFILLRFAVLPNCICLVVMLVYHTVLYRNHLDLRYLAINFSILGGLFMLIAETQKEEAHNTSAMVEIVQPEAPKDKRSKSMLLLTGRMLLPLMFFALLRWEPTHPLRMAELCVATVLMCMVLVGFHARPSTMALALWLAFINVTQFAWWQMPVTHPYREFLKFDYFQTLSVIGGLLLAFAHGPGRISMDAYNKKQW